MLNNSNNGRNRMKSADKIFNEPPSHARAEIDLYQLLLAVFATWIFNELTTTGLKLTYVS